MMDELNHILKTYIDKVKAKAFSEGWNACAKENGTRDAEPPVKDVPDIRVGEWTKAYDGNDGHVRCTACFKTYDYVTQAQHFNYCPNCGAKVQGWNE